MNWVNKKKLPVIETIKYNGQQYVDINDLWCALHSTFNTANNRQVDTSILDEISNKPIVPWPEFSREEFKFALSSCNNSSAPGPDKLSWNHLKTIFDEIECLDTFVRMANTCINLGYWLLHFKTSTTIVIPKPNKKSYDSPKSFRPIVLLNTMGKLIEKVIGERLQFHTVSNDFIHPSQLGGLKFKSTTNTSITLMHTIRTGWVKNLTTSTLTFDITQSPTPFSHHKESGL